MISQDDIDAFLDDLHPDVRAAVEYSRRADKGLPSDRWTDGHAGAVKVKLGIDRLVQTAFRQALEDYQRGQEAMEPHRDPCRE